MDPGLRGKVFKVEALPVPSHILLRLIKSSSEDSENGSELGELIASDTSLLAQVLKVANSAFYGYSGKVQSIDKAILLLGPREIWRIAVGIALHQQFYSSSLPSSFRYKDFWTHSFLTACLSQALFEIVGTPHEGAYAIGLLHDIGRLVMAVCFENAFEAIETQVMEEGINHWEAEERLDVFHTELGFWVARRWRLPESIQESCLEHHFVNPMGQDVSKNGYLVGIANALAVCIQNDLNPAQSIEKLRPQLKGKIPSWEEAFEKLYSRRKHYLEKVSETTNVLWTG